LPPQAPCPAARRRGARAMPHARRPPARPPRPTSDRSGSVSFETSQRLALLGKLSADGLDDVGHADLLALGQREKGSVARGELDPRARERRLLAECGPVDRSPELDSRWRTLRYGALPELDALRRAGRQEVDHEADPPEKGGVEVPLAVRGQDRNP